MHDSLVDDAGMPAIVSAAIEALPRPILVTDYETMLYVNACGRELLGADSTAEIYDRPIQELVHPDAHEAMFERRPLVLNSRQSVRGIPMKLRGIDGRVVTPRGDVVPVEFGGRMRALVLLDVAVPHRACSVEADGGCDVKDGVALFEHLPLCMLIHDNNRILAANASSRQFLGMTSADQIVGRPIGSIVHPDGREAGESRRKLAAEFGIRRFLGVPVKLQRRDGSDVRLEVDAMTLTVGDRRVLLVTPSAL